MSPNELYVVSRMLAKLVQCLKQSYKEGEPTNNWSPSFFMQLGSVRTFQSVLEIHCKMDPKDTLTQQLVEMTRELTDKVAARVFTDGPEPPTKNPSQN